MELVSKVLRPWMFRVTVRGEPPHPFTRVYTVVAPPGCDVESGADSCALTGLRLFVKEFSPKGPLTENVVVMAPKVKFA